MVGAMITRQWQQRAISMPTDEEIVVKIIAEMVANLDDVVAGVEDLRARLNPAHGVGE